MAVDTQGKYHMVYEDNGRIWYTYSTNGGSSWQKEIPLTDDYVTCKNPSISIGYDNKYHVVWQENFVLGNSIQYLKEGSSAEWIGDIPNSYNSYPVVATNSIYDFVMVAWNDGSKLRYKVYTSEEDWSDVETVPNTNSSCIYPALANDGSSSYATHLAWQRGNEIYYQNMNYFVDEEEEEYFFSWRHYKCVSDVQSINESGYPSIAVRRVDRKPVITWQAFDARYEWIDKLIVYRKKSSTSSSNWGTCSEFIVEDNESYQPAVTTYLNNDYNDATIVWYTDDHEIKKVNKENGSWSSIQQITTDGHHPNISIFPNNVSSMSNDNIIVYGKYNSAPYLLKTEEAGLGIQGKTSSNLATDSRTEDYPLDLFSLEKEAKPVNYGSFSFSLKVPSLSFPQINDTLLYEPFFKSNPIASDKLEFTYSVNPQKLNVKALQKAFKNFAPYLLKIVLKENESDKIVEEVRTVTLQDLIDIAASKESRFEESLSIDVSGYKSYDVYLDVLSNIQQTEKYIPQRIVSYKGESSFELNKELAAKEKPAEIFGSFKLYANYPNPFNPVTTIAYDLPEGCRVNVSVYDVNGKKLADLENSFKESGKHAVTFDGSDFSSGIYFYRIKAGNYSSVKRMLLMK